MALPVFFRRCGEKIPPDLPTPPWDKYNKQNPISKVNLLAEKSTVASQYLSLVTPKHSHV